MRRNEWRILAQRRVLNILRTRRIASQAQLEAKICEAGPGNMRANPHYITQALTSLQNEDRIQQPETVSLTPQGPQTKLFTLPSWDPTSNASDRERLERIIPAYREYLRFQNQDNGVSLETVVQEAIKRSEQFTWHNEPGRAPPGGTKFSGIDITGPEGTLDHYLVHNQIPIGVEDKNHRDWFYPGDPHIRTLLGKCVSYHMLPVLVTRRVHFTTRLVFSRLGAIALETYFQFIQPKHEQPLADVRHKDGVGFADIRFTDIPPAHVTNLFSKLLPNLIPRSWETFNNNINLIRDYSEEKITYRELTVELGIVEEEEEEEEYQGEED